MSESHDVTLHVRVHDERELWIAARAHYQGANPSADEEDLDSLFGNGTDEDDPYDVSGCLRELLDPGVSPPGCEIEESSVECVEFM